MNLLTLTNLLIFLTMMSAVNSSLWLERYADKSKEVPLLFQSLLKLVEDPSKLLEVGNEIQSYLMPEPAYFDDVTGLLKLLLTENALKESGRIVYPGELNIDSIVMDVMKKLMEKGSDENNFNAVLDSAFKQIETSLFYSAEQQVKGWVMNEQFQYKEQDFFQDSLVYIFSFVSKNPNADKVIVQLKEYLNAMTSVSGKTTEISTIYADFLKLFFSKKYPQKINSLKISPLMIKH